MIYKVLIPTAGIGSRLLKETQNINKSLVLIDHKPIISHIIEKFPLNVEIVIALGYKGNYLKQYLSLAHSDTNIKYVMIRDYYSNKSGLGLTLLKSEKLLFLF